ncbi:MAG: hypothetical protein H0X25_06535 [Acidobacteriales bacterium]|nr:hypothetical protein [Terriglobales bacterium]
MERPGGVRAIAMVFFAAAVYLLGSGLVMLLAPGTLSMAAGAPLLSGLELAGPYMFLLTATVGLLTGFGLLRLNNWARRAAIALAFAGFVLLIPTVSSSVVDFRIGSLAWGGLGIIVRVMIVWYLFQLHIREAFEK